jgi:hypothetical protein
MTNSLISKMKARNTNLALQKIETRGPHPLLLLLFSLLVCLITFGTIWNRLTIQVAGTVTSSVEIPPSWYSHGTGTAYVIRGPDGSEQRYTAGATDASLPQHIPVGTSIEKVKWETSFLENGARVDEGWQYSRSTRLGIALCVFIWSFSEWRSRIEFNKEKK